MSTQQDDGSGKGRPSEVGVLVRRLGLLLGLAVAGLVLAKTFVPTLKAASSASPEVRCAANLRMIGQAIQFYANENAGQYPSTFDLLFSTQDLPASAACCPATRLRPPSAMPPAQWFNVASSYLYLGAGLDTSCPRRVIVAHDRPENHARDGGGINVLFADGSVQFIQPGAWPIALSNSLGARTQWEVVNFKMPTTRPKP